MLTVNDAGGTHNTQVTTTKNDLIISGYYGTIGGIDFDTSHANQANTTETRRNPYLR